MKKPLSELIPRLARGIAPSAAVASGLLAPLAMGESGDLDPGFADVGRLSQIVDLDGAIWSVELLDDGGAVIAGGDVDFRCSYWYDCEIRGSNFVGQLTDEGEIDSSYIAARPAGIEVRDAARQPDGKMVMVGRRAGLRSSVSDKLVVYRLERDGAMDPTFGIDGIFELPSEVYGNRHSANAVVLDPDGRIVVAGSLGNESIVLRLLVGGTLDESFGNAGVLVGPLQDYYSGAHIERTAAGGYRVTTSSDSRCQIIGLTSIGHLDSSFGTEGIAPVATPLGDANYCSAISTQSNDRLLVAGNAGGQGFAASLTATGAPDSAFAADPVASAMSDATAITAAGDGKILVAGPGDEGTMIMRLLSDGGLDPSFGNAGSTLIDLPSEHGAYSVVNDLIVRPDGSLLAAGGDSQSDAPFVVRLLGDGGGDGPGVLSVVQAGVDATEADQAVVHVRRTGGKTGDVSVAYETERADVSPATSGQDFDAVSGRLTWADGDTSTREIVVQVHDDDGAVEEYEQFWISLSDAQGGAGIGTRNATVNIAADGEPAGQFAIYDFGEVIGESGPYQIFIYRNFYFEGAVSVTLTPVSGTATAGADFEAAPVTVSWADQDSEGKLVEIPINNDSDQEGSEIFNVELSNPTGGALIGPNSAATVTIEANDAPVPPPSPPPPPAPSPNRGGGGSTGFLMLLLLGLAEFLRSLRYSARRLG